MIHTQQVVQAFQAHFNGKPEFVVRGPGRVNLIGEHTDYNDGFVLPVAIDRAAWIGLRRTGNAHVQVRSLDLGETARFELPRLERGNGWAEYVKAMAWALQQSGLELQGWEGVLIGDVPIGAGLSSSAAVELAVARAFCAVSGFDWEARRMARLAQQAENEWVGVNCGIMDQMVSAAAEAGTALFLDCRSLEFEHLPLPAEVAVVVLDTSTRRGLVDSAYNDRRSQCEQAARYFGVPALRDVSSADFAARGAGLEAVARRRARHIISENERVLGALQAIHAGDMRALGTLFNESHASLRDDFEVSSQALDRIVEAAQAQPGCLGARMTGAGFGGCAVALVEAATLEAFVPAVAAAYRRGSGVEAVVYVCRPSAGASVEFSANSSA
jgi:galactokinase